MHEETKQRHKHTLISKDDRSEVGMMFSCTLSTHEATEIVNGRPQSNNKRWKYPQIYLDSLNVLNFTLCNVI